MYIRGSTFKLFSSSLLLNSDISCPTWLQQQTDGEWECTLEEYLKEKWYACLERERGYCSSRKWHTQASIDSLVAIRPILICKKPPSLSSCGQFMATSPPHTSFVRNAIIIAPLSLSPMWHPYLKSIFSQRKHCPYSSSAYKPTNLRRKSHPGCKRDYKSIKFEQMCLLCIVFSYRSVYFKHHKSLSFLWSEQRQLQLTSSLHTRGKNYEETFQTRPTVSCVCAYSKFPLHSSACNSKQIPGIIKTISNLIFCWFPFFRDIIREIIGTQMT